MVDAHPDDDWDLDDDVDWTGSSVNGASSEAAKRRNTLRRTNMEVGIGCACHFIVMCCYMYIHVYDATVFKRNKGKGFEGAGTYGRRWKYLTYINMWIQFIYFFFAFFTDVMPRSQAKIYCQKACSLIFTTIGFPLTLFVCVAFWGIYAVDREFVYPVYLDEHIPSMLNHYWHTTIVVGVFLELVVVFHRFPSNMTALWVIFLFTTTYITWIVSVFSNAQVWPYPFMDLMPVPLFPVLFLACFFVTVAMYALGMNLGYLRWNARHKLMDKLGK